MFVYKATHIVYKKGDNCVKYKIKDIDKYSIYIYNELTCDISGYARLQEYKNKEAMCYLGRLLDWEKPLEYILYNDANIVLTLLYPAFCGMTGFDSFDLVNEEAV